MNVKLNPDSVFVPSDKVVPRLIRDKLIIIPIEDGVADLNDAMFSFNETGTLIWECIEQKKTVRQINETLVAEYDAAPDQIENGVTGLISTLLAKGIVQEWKS